jgi:hypothetical protein
VIHTPEKLRNQARRLDRRVNRVTRVVSAMHDGAALHCEYRPHERWWLSDGTEVSAVTAHDVIEHPKIVGVGDALFGFTPSQTFRYVEDHRD